MAVTGLSRQITMVLWSLLSNGVIAYYICSMTFLAADANLMDFPSEPHLLPKTAQRGHTCPQCPKAILATLYPCIWGM